MTTNLPLILAGPILRRIECNRVCVWIATSKKVNITIDILRQTKITNNGSNGNNNFIEMDIHEKGQDPNSLSNNTQTGLIAIGAGKNTFLKLGNSLFINLLNAEPILGHETRLDSNSRPSFPKDELLFYDLNFEFENEKSTEQYSLGDLGLLDGPNSIIYGSQSQEINSNVGGFVASEPRVHYRNVNLPSFFIPSKTNNSKLNILYGSCRKLHGDDEDNLVIADRIVSENFFDLHKRPSALFLIGDQIYADNVAGPLITHITNLSKKILGWEERITGLDYPLSCFKIGQRKSKVKELTQFSSDDADNHLLGLGEFAAMYITAWNQEIWPDDFEMMQTGTFTDSKNAKKYKLELRHLYHSRNVLRYVRRLLANVPTYMICDDHEITDDWNINKKWYQSVFNSKAGNQVIANGLVAYWAFQAWGNEPSNFDDDFKDLIKSYVKQRELLSFQSLENKQTVYDSGKQHSDKINSGTNEIRNLEEQILALKKWTFVAPTYPVSLFLDCRTQRKFEDEEGPPILLDEQALETAKNKLYENGYNCGDPLIIVSPTPVLGFELAESVQRFLTAISGTYKWDLETWRANEDGFVKFLTFLHDNFNPALCVFLSGDVHYAFTMKGEMAKNCFLSDKSTLGKPYTDFQDEAVVKLNCINEKTNVKNKVCENDKFSSKLRMIQLTSSPFKSNSTDNRFVAILILNLVHMLVITTRRVLMHRGKFDYKRVYQWQFGKFRQTREGKQDLILSGLNKYDLSVPRYYSAHDDKHQNLFSKLIAISESLRTRYFVRTKINLLPYFLHVEEARLLLTPDCFLPSPVVSSNNLGQVSLNYTNKMVTHTLLFKIGNKIKSKKIDVCFY
ncbi:MAG: hypothetical protein AB7V56_04470 [Candidatus Nitrosocosmicus sp.]